MMKAAELRISNPGPTRLPGETLSGVPEKRRQADSLKRKSMVSSGDRSAKIRTYNYPQGRVTEHRIGLTLYDLPKIINGDIQKIIDELMLEENSEILKANNFIMKPKIYNLGYNKNNGKKIVKRTYFIKKNI